MANPGILVGFDYNRSPITNAAVQVQEAGLRGQSMELRQRAEERAQAGEQRTQELFPYQLRRSQAETEKMQLETDRTREDEKRRRESETLATDFLASFNSDKPPTYEDSLHFGVKMAVLRRDPNLLSQSMSGLKAYQLKGEGSADDQALFEKVKKYAGDMNNLTPEAATEIAEHMGTHWKAAGHPTYDNLAKAVQNAWKTNLPPAAVQALQDFTEAVAAGDEGDDNGMLWEKILEDNGAAAVFFDRNPNLVPSRVKDVAKEGRDARIARRKEEERRKTVEAQNRYRLEAIQERLKADLEKIELRNQGAMDRVREAAKLRNAAAGAGGVGARAQRRFHLDALRQERQAINSDRVEIARRVTELSKAAKEELSVEGQRQFQARLAELDRKRDQLDQRSAELHAAITSLEAHAAGDDATYGGEGKAPGKTLPPRAGQAPAPPTVEGPQGPQTRSQQIIGRVRAIQDLQTKSIADRRKTVKQIVKELAGKNITDDQADEALRAAGL